jgi:hypothetical protein
MSDTGGRTRREIMADAAKMAAAASVTGLAGCFPSVGGHWAPACVDPDAGANANLPIPRQVTPTVVEVLNANSINASYIIQPEVVADMLDAGLTALAQKAAQFNATLPPVDAGVDDSDVYASDADGGVDDGGAGAWGVGSDPDNPWRVLLPKYRPGMRIGLKVNCLSPYVPTSPALVHAIIVSLRDKLGVDPAKIVVWDRRLDELNRHGKYSADDLAGAQLRGTRRDQPQDGGISDTNTDVQPGYGDQISPTIECRSPRLSRILTELTDLTINCPVFKRHMVSGVTAAMKNIYGIIDIPGSYHRPVLETGLPKLYALPAIRNSISLNIVDALIAEVNNDTADPSDFAPTRILLSQDPVAMDSYALVLLNKIRASIGGGAGLPPIETSLTGWIDKAAALGLGTKSFSLIPLVQG